MDGKLYMPRYTNEMLGVNRVFEVAFPLTHTV